MGALHLRGAPLAAAALLAVALGAGCSLAYSTHCYDGACDGSGLALDGAALAAEGGAPTYAPDAADDAPAPEDADHCGSNGDVCPEQRHALRTCTAGACGYACAPGWADYNGQADDGCEAIDVLGRTLRSPNGAVFAVASPGGGLVLDSPGPDLHPVVLADLAADLPTDDYVVIAKLHALGAGAELGVVVRAGAGAGGAVVATNFGGSGKPFVGAIADLTTVQATLGTSGDPFPVVKDAEYLLTVTVTGGVVSADLREVGGGADVLFAGGAGAHVSGKSLGFYVYWPSAPFGPAAPAPVESLIVIPK